MGGRIETATARRAGHELPPGAAADHGGDAGGDAALRRHHGGGAVDAGRDRAPRAPRRSRARPTPAATTCSATRRCRSSGSVRCCRPAGAARTSGPLAHRWWWSQSAQQRIALHVDEVLGNQEVVVKNLGPQLSRLPGLAGITLLASGARGADLQPGGAGHAVRRAARAPRCAPAPARWRSRAMPRPPVRRARRWCWWSTIR